MTQTPYDFTAQFFDGLRATAYPVEVTLTTESLLIKHASFTRRYALVNCTLQSPLGGGLSVIDLPNQAKLESQDAALVAAWPATPVRRWQQRLHLLEHHWAGIVLAIAGIIAFSLFVLYIAVPQLTRLVAMRLPYSLEQKIGAESLRTLENPALGYFAASRLHPGEQQAVRQALQSFCQHTRCPSYQLLFKASPVLGANAFAIPGGYIVVTDALVKLAKQPEEVVAVLAHEMGHLQQRHALRQTIQTTLSGLLVLTLTGDVSSIAAGLPTVLMNMHYSRDMEEEADRYALQHMQQACLPGHYFATILVRLASQAPRSQKAMKVPELLSSHPDPKARIQLFLQPTAACAAH
ncbi:MAG TPA: M48 family metallopeptidase [Methylophilus sp.]